ncbi:MAG: glycosyltransferase [Deltaproteobacteria bacterium]|nr:glycosyltransferase [Deltaproteobacteria bacterium]
MSARRSDEFTSASPRPSVAICGTRGIPARYGGFETFAEELSQRLVAQGYPTRVYCRHSTTPELKSIDGVELVHLPAPRHKYLETVVHTFLSFLHLLVYPVDVVILCNAANAPLLPILKLRRIRVATNVDGIERNRAKWNSIGKLWYRLGEWSAARWSHRVISDADFIRDYYRERFGVASDVIRYGYSAAHEELVAEKVAGNPYTIPAWRDLAVVREFGLEPNQYILYVSRFEPENNALLVIQAFRQLDPSRRPPLVLVGDAPYADDYKRALREASGECPDIHFAGYRFGEEYRALQIGALLYVQATEVGGTHPALVEAMGFGNCVLANDVPEHRETLGNTGVYYAKNDFSDLTRQLQTLLADAANLSRLRQRAFEKAQSDYRWESIAKLYISLVTRLCPAPRTKT